MKKLFKIVAIILFLLLFCFFGAFYYFRSLITDANTIVHQSLPLPSQKNTILCIFAHPDDEIVMAGTLYKIASQPDNRLIVIYLARGEAGPTGGLVAQKDLGKFRTKELQQVAQIIGYDILEFLDYPDGGLLTMDSSLAQKAIKALIYKYKANVILTYDDKVGLYGHPDHLLTGKWTRAVVKEEMGKAGFPVQKLYCATLAIQMIETAKKMSKTFKEHYPKEKGKGLPPPDFAVQIGEVGTYKLQAIQAHQSQKQVFQDVFPLYKYFPAWIYFRVFDREYFSLMEGK